MELHFSEISEENSEENSEKFPPVTTYDDILARLNVKIVDGKMQYISPSGITNELFKAKVPKNNGSGSGSDKTSYIYNKYFKNMKADRPAVSPAKSREEYNKRLADAMRKHYTEQKQMSQAKSRKLAFHSNPTYSSRIADPDTLFRINLKR